VQTDRNMKCNFRSSGSYAATSYQTPPCTVILYSFCDSGIWTNSCASYAFALPLQPHHQNVLVLDNYFRWVSSFCRGESCTVTLLRIPPVELEIGKRSQRDYHRLFLDFSSQKNERQNCSICMSQGVRSFSIATNINKDLLSLWAMEHSHTGAPVHFLGSNTSTMCSVTFCLVSGVLCLRILHITSVECRNWEQRSIVYGPTQRPESSFLIPCVSTCPGKSGIWSVYLLIGR
jgi:hypothetical protein